jgi:hypothetical protein
VIEAQAPSWSPVTFELWPTAVPVTPAPRAVVVSRTFGAALVRQIDSGQALERYCVPVNFWQTPASSPVTFGL